MANNSTSENILNPELIAKRGEDIYRTKFKDALEREHKGEFVAIDVQTERYFLGRSPEEALEVARKEVPDTIFHLIRIGYAGVYKVSWSAGLRDYGWVF